ncbi:hypothetical protein GQ55_3G018100 [Panicum hallii var. hallii]|uniref:Uncharacterized protein n=1 Tax=Panicum hallii var. hallii TaxID=1504633 RepID=A0A2T7E4S4_9POAL|nr:hypothetical protein GQ55_3G018100 [Panicum hallii var. hallii]
MDSTRTILRPEPSPLEISQPRCLTTSSPLFPSDTGRDGPPAVPIDVDDLLAEILLRLPALPSASPCPCAAKAQLAAPMNGRVLLTSRTRYGYGLRQVLAWNPVAGEHHLLGTPHVSDSNWDR